jgi:6-phosphogluconolactonase
VVARLAGEAIDARGVFHLALAGGSTPERCHELLAESGLDWERVHLWESDERCVPPDDDESNFLMIRRSLLDRIEIPDGNVHRAPGELGPDEGARAYERELGEVMLDVVMCGMGPDGHTMSLFPHHPLLEVTHRLVAGIDDSPKPPPERITFTLPLVHAARRTILLVSGEGKAEALGRVCEGPDPSTPASLLRLGRLEVIADDAAAPARR